MSIVAQAGVFAFGPQGGKEVTASTLYKHRASDIDLAAISDDRLGPPEVGGTPVPTVPYRAGIMAAGGATIAPRLENSFGWLLQGVAGDSTVTSGEDVFGTTVTNFYHHEFTYDTESEGFVPWMTFYKEIPAADTTDRLGETYEDCKIVNMTVSLPNDGLIQTRIDVIGRMADNTTQWETNPTKTYGNTNYEDFESIPIGSNVGGYIQIPDFSAEDLPVVMCNVNFQNAPLDIRQEKVYGSPYLEDITIVGRALTFDMVVKWQDSALYRSILTGSTTSTTWQCSPFISDLDVYALTCEDSLGVGTPWQMRVVAPKVMLQMVGGIRLAGNEAVMMRLQGTAIKGTDDYFTIHLGNTTPAYVWPSGGGS